MINSTLPVGFTLRNAAWTDQEGIFDLINTVCKAYGDESMSFKPNELRVHAANWVWVRLS
jgi:hypothetical protein